MTQLTLENFVQDCVKKEPGFAGRGYFINGFNIDNSIYIIENRIIKSALILVPPLSEIECFGGRIATQDMRKVGNNEDYKYLLECLRLPDECYDAILLENYPYQRDSFLITPSVIQKKYELSIGADGEVDVRIMHLK
jgi:hypothetical protein